MFSVVIEDVHSFALEPHGSKFGVVHGDPPTRISASFYAINSKGNKLTKISEYGGRSHLCTGVNNLN